MVPICVMFAQRLDSLPSGKCRHPHSTFALIAPFHLQFYSLLFPVCRAEREYVVQEDFMKAVRKVSDNKKLESKLDYKPV